jgi:hypothetical protein
LLGGDAPPNKVLEIKNDGHVNGHILHRDDSMVLYAPIAVAGDKRDKPIYEILIHRPMTETGNSSFRLVGMLIYLSCIIDHLFYCFQLVSMCHARGGRGQVSGLLASGADFRSDRQRSQLNMILARFVVL